MIICLSLLFISDNAHAASVISVSGPDDGALRNAVASASPGDIIEITGDITIGTYINITPSKNITICSEPGKQWALYKNSAGRHFVVSGDSTSIGVLTLENIILDGGGTRGGVSAGSVDLSVDGGILHLNEGAAIQNCSGVGANNGGGITVNNGGAVTVNGGAIRNNTKNSTNGGGGVLVSGTGSSFTLNHGTVNGNQAVGSATYAHTGGGITALAGATVNINGGVISDNTANAYGGGISVTGATLNVTAGEISSNRVQVYTTCAGGGIFLGKNAVLNMTGGTISGNTVKGHGGGIGTVLSANEYPVSANIINAVITGNSAVGGGSGGGIFTKAADSESVIIKNSIINGNAAGNGGAVSISGKNEITIGDCIITGNAAAAGGAVFGYAGSEIILNNSSVSGNTASSFGGGVYTEPGSGIIISNCEIGNNGKQMTVGGTSRGPTISGGGIYINANTTQASSLIIQDGSIIEDNYADNGGGIYTSLYANVTVSDSTVRGNAAGINGGGLWGGYFVTLQDAAQIINNSADASGGGVFISVLTRLKTNGIVFSNNRASVGYKWTLDTAASDPAVVSNSLTHQANIIDTAYTIPFTNAYNNYDVNFTDIAEATIAYYTVTFDSKDGSPVPAQTVENGGKVTEPSEPDRAGYKFNGWYKESEYLNPWNFTADTVTSDITLYAKWEPARILPPPEAEKSHIRYIYGYPDKSVQPDTSLRRAEAAVIFDRLIQLPDAQGYLTSEFSDVTAGSWYYHAVTHLAGYGIMSGYPDGTFKPEEYLTGAEFLELISILGDIAFDINPYPPDEIITRAKAISIINQILDRKINPEDIPPDTTRYIDLTSRHWAYSEIIEASVGHVYKRKENGYEIWINANS